MEELEVAPQAKSIQSLTEYENSITMSMADMREHREEQEDLETTLSIVDAVNSVAYRKSAIAAHGRSNTTSESMKSLEESGILPLSRARYDSILRRQSGKELFNTLKLNRMTLKDTKGYRIRMAYRLIRYMARVRGDIPGTAMTSTSLVDKWKRPEKYHAGRGYNIGLETVSVALNSWSRSNNTFTFYDEGSYRTLRGCTYLPPDIPDKFYMEAGAESREEIWDMRLNRIVPEHYDPEDDDALYYFCKSMELLAENIKAHRGTLMEPECGMFGIAGLLNPTVARIAWPTQHEIIMYEDEMCIFLYNEVIQKGSEQSAANSISSLLGVSTMEAIDLAKMASEMGANIFRQDMEQNRVLSIDRLARLGEKAESIDMRVTLATYKEQHKLRGLTRTEAMSSEEDTKDMVISASNQKQVK